MSFRLNLVAEDVGPWEGRHELGTIEPGYNLVKGPNGSGKTTLMKYIGVLAKKRLLRGDIELCDHASRSRGHLDVGDARLEIRATKGAPKRSGTGSLPEIEPLPEPVAALEHGLHRKGEGPAFRARLAALCELLELEAEDDAIKSIAGEDRELREDVLSVTAGDYSGSLVDVAEEARKAAHGHRRLWEARAEGAGKRRDEIEAQRLQALRDSLQREGASLEELLELASGAPELEEAERAFSEASHALEAARTEAAARRAEENRREELRAQWAGFEPPSIELAEAAVEDANAEAAEHKASLDKARDRVAALESELAEAKGYLKSQESNHNRALDDQEKARQALEKARENRRHYDLAMESLENPLPPGADLEAAKARQGDARAALDIATARARSDRFAADGKDAEREFLEAEDQAERYEDEARLVWDRLAEWINRSLDSDVIRVEGEAIECNVDGGWVDISSDRVSEGRRAEICYRLLLERRTGDRLVLIDGVSPLDAERRRLVGDLAREKGIAVVGEAPSDDDEWRLEVF